MLNAKSNSSYSLCLWLMIIVLLTITNKCYGSIYIKFCSEGGSCDRRDPNQNNLNQYANLNTFCFGFDSAGLGPMPGAMTGYVCKLITTDPFICSMATFGSDPAFGQSKSCWLLMPYNKIPNFDFTAVANKITSLPKSAYTLGSTASRCEDKNSSPACVGFNNPSGSNTARTVKSNFDSPAIVSATDFYVHDVTYGVQFVKINGWTIVSPTSGTVKVFNGLNAIDCAYQCTVASVCAGAVLLSNGVCALYPSYENGVSQQSISTLLIPAGPRGCPASVISAGNCISTSRPTAAPSKNPSFKPSVTPSKKPCVCV